MALYDRPMLKPSRAKRLSDLLPASLGPAAARQGFASAEILARWEAIVGPELAAISAPLKLSVPPRATAAGPDAPAPQATLTLRVEGAFALEVQHRAGEIVGRVNAHLGWPCVGAVKLRQGSLPGRGLARRAAPQATEEETRRVAEAAARIEEPELGEALRRLGEAALAKSRR